GADAAAHRHRLVADEAKFTPPDVDQRRLHGRPGEVALPLDLDLRLIRRAVDAEVALDARGEPSVAAPARALARVAALRAETGVVGHRGAAAGAGRRGWSLFGWHGSAAY